MRAVKLKLTNISPLNYYYSQGGQLERPSTFIGDIALKYSMLHQLGLGNFFDAGSYQPNYSELTGYDFWFTVAMPLNDSTGQLMGVDFMKPIIRNTMHGIDFNGSNVHPEINAGSSLYKNFYMQQYLKPGNKFIAYFISEKEMDLPPVLRVGTGKGGLIKVEKVRDDNQIKAYVNLYTIRNIIRKTDVYDKISKMTLPYFEHITLPYIIVGPIEDLRILTMIYERSDH